MLKVLCLENPTLHSICYSLKIYIILSYLFKVVYFEKCRIFSDHTVMQKALPSKFLVDINKISRKLQSSYRFLMTF